MMSQQYGATVHESGVAFRVWAPSAEAVGVKGDFNNWAEQPVVMERQPDGSWFVDITGAKPGQEYKYVITYEGHNLERNDPRAMQLTPSGDATVIIDPDFDWDDAGFTMPVLEQLVIYELHVGTFARHDPAQPGTFADATTKLDHIANLGVNAIEIMPASTAWMDRWWGYTPTNIYAVEASYGGRRGLQEFVAAAHAHGIAVILDVVYNHFSRDAGLDLWQFDGWQQNDMGGIYFYNDERASTPYGDTRPDFSRPEVRRYITDNARMWLEDCHVDGLRVDSTITIRNWKVQNNDPAHDLPEGWKLLQEINAQAHDTKAGALMIGEDLQGNEAITSPAELGGAGFDTQWDVMFECILREELAPADDAKRRLGQIALALTHNMNHNYDTRVVYSESHDADANGHARFGEEVTPGNAGSYLARKRSALAASLLMTTPGIPMLFQGQEFQQGGAFTHWSPLDWANIDTYAGITQLYQHLIALRQNRYHSTAGLLGQNIDVFLQDDTNKILAYHRWDKAGAGDDVVIVANLGNQPHLNYELAFPRAGAWRARFNSDWRGYSADFGDVGVDQVTDVTPDAQDPGRFTGKVNIGAYAVLIISSDK